MRLRNLKSVATFGFVFLLFCVGQAQAASPSITSLSPTSGAVGASVTITGTNFGSTQGTSTAKFNGTTATIISWSGTSIVAKVPSGATTGNVVVTVAGSASNGKSFTVLPTPSITNLSVTTGTIGAPVTIAGANFGSTQGTSTVKFNGTTATVTSWSASSIAVTVPNGATTGNVVVHASGVDTNGVSFTVVFPPDIATVAPASAAAGSSITISGSGFGASQGSSMVTFNGALATPTTWSATQITVPVPSAATTGNILIQANGLASNLVAFTVLPTPVIANLSPSIGGVGTIFQVSGANFGSSQGTSTVALNGAATSVASWSPTNIVATVPTGATTGNVIVTVAGVPSNPVSFTLTTVPTITSLSTDSGSAGTPITISGSNFGSTQGTSSVSFNGTTATTTSWSATSIVAPVPAGATSGPVTVTVSGSPSNGVSFTTPGRPNISSLSPTSGRVGTSVTITGTNFGLTQGTSTVTFEVAAATPTSWSPTQIIVPVPAGATNGNVTVTASGITGSAAFFTVIVAPVISSISPNTGTPGTQVTITGSGFGGTQGASTVTFNGVSATPTSWSDTSIVVPSPSGSSSGRVIVAVSGTASNGVTFTTIPMITSLSPTSGIIGTSVTIAGVSLSVASKFLFFHDGFGQECLATATSTSDTMFVVPVPSCAATSNLAVSYQDANFNTLLSNAILFTVNPSITSLSPTSGTVGTSVQINGGPFGVSQGTSTLTFNGTPAAPTSWSPTQIVTFPPVGSTSGNVVVTVGGQTTNPQPFTLNPSPVLTSLSPATGSAGTSVTIAGSGFGTTQGSSAVTFNGTAATPTTWSPGSIVVPVPAGAFTGNVIVTSPTGAASNGLNFTVILPPSISFLSTASGSASGSVGLPVSIFGSGFGNTQGTSTVKFNGTAATPTLWSPNEIDVTVPSGATTGNIVVTIPGLPPSNGFAFTVVPRATITTLSATSGPAGFPVTITGTNFGTSAGSNTVTFNGTAATVISSTSTSIATTVPEGATTGNVVVTTTNGPSTGVAFSVTPGPGITGVSPAKGGVGATVTITGAAFGQSRGTSSVKFNGTVATPAIWSDTGIIVPVPAGATTGNVVVMVGSATSNGVSFTVSSGLSVTAVTPNSGNTSDIVTITGTGFGTSQGSSTVTFNGVKATPTVWTSTSITASVPASATSGPVVVTVGGALSDGVNFTVGPEITGVSPNPAAVSATVAVTGANFGATRGTSIVTCNGVSIVSSSWSSSSIVLSGCAANLGPVPIQITVNGVSSAVATVNVIPDATLSGVIPITAPVGAPVFIRGKNFGATQGQSSVTINGKVAIPTSWSDTQLVVSVPSGAAASGSVNVVVGGITAMPGFGFTVGTAPAPNSVQIAPSGVTMLIGDTQQFNVVDQFGSARFDATWTVDNTSLGTITASSSPKTGSYAVLTAVAAGTVTLTATVQGVSAHMPVTISSLASFPPGTILWSAPPVSGFTPQQIVQAVPTDGGPDLYSIKKSSDGTQTIVQAFTADGQQMWQTTAPPMAPGAMSDALGNLVGVGTCDTVNPLSIVIVRVFGGEETIPFPALAGGLCPAGVPKLAARQDGSLVVTGPLQISPALMIIDQNTGNQLPAPPIPPSTFTGTVFGQDPQAVSCDCFTRVGQPMVDSDGSTYLGYDVRQVVHGTTTSAILSLMKIATDGTTSVTQLTSTANANQAELWPGMIIPDGQGGVLATWVVAPVQGVQPPNPYQAAHLTPDGGLTTYVLPMAPTQVATINGIPIDVQLVLGENGTAFISYGGPNVVSFNLNTGSLNWSSQTGGSIIAATDNGSVAINNSQQGIFQLDTSGAATQITSASAFSLPSYSWADAWYAFSGSNPTGIVLPISVDEADPWATPGGNASQAGEADALCDCLVETTSPAPPPPPATCPICNLASDTIPPSQAPSCTSTPGALSTYLILVGDPSTSPTGDHNVGNLFNLAAQTQANTWQAQGHHVVACRVSTVQHVGQALTTNGLVDGGVIFFGHAGRLPRPDLPGVLYSLVSVGQATDDSANISYLNVISLLNTQLGASATITLKGCFAGKSWSPGQPAIAQLVANRLRRNVFAYKVGMAFSQNPNDTHFRSNPPNSLPMYMLPQGGTPRPEPTSFAPH